MVVGVDAHDLSFTYPGGVRAIAGVSFTLAPRELCAVLGPNGSGKSTLLKLVAGLLRPDSGRVVASGVEVARVAPRRRARAIALVPQSLERLPEVRVHDFVLGGRYPHLGAFRSARPADLEAVARAVHEADASAWTGRLLTELSGGERQRVFIARALAQQTDVLLLDEPTASLDPEHQLMVMRLVRALCEAGRAVAVVTHDLNLASQFGDRLVLLHEGRVAASGPAVEVLRPEVLAPVYGPGLWYGAFPDGSPLVLPHRGRASGPPPSGVPRAGEPPSGWLPPAAEPRSEAP